MAENRVLLNSDGSLRSLEPPGPLQPLGLLGSLGPLGSLGSALGPSPCWI